MLDTATTAMEITHKHSSTCALNKYIEMHGGIDNLQIEDVRTLVRADQEVFPEMIPITMPTTDPSTTAVTSGINVHTDLPSLVDEQQMTSPKPILPLPMVTDSSSTMSAVTQDVDNANTPHDMPLQMVTTLSTPLTHGTFTVTATTLPLHLVTMPTTCSNTVLVSAPTTSAITTTRQLK